MRSRVVPVSSTFDSLSLSMLFLHEAIGPPTMIVSSSGFGLATTPD